MCNHRTLVDRLVAVILIITILVLIVAFIGTNLSTKEDGHNHSCYGRHYYWLAILFFFLIIALGVSDWIRFFFFIVFILALIAIPPKGIGCRAKY